MISVEEFKQHFLSVSEIMGVFECEFWDIKYFGDHWKIINKVGDFEFSSWLNGYDKEYTDFDKILREMFALDIKTRILLQTKTYWVPEECEYVPWEICRIERPYEVIDESVE